MENAKRTLIRAGIVVIWLILGIVIFIFARGHTLLVDNHNVDMPEIRAPDKVIVFVDEKNGISLLRGERDRLTVTGSRHRIKIEFADGRNPFEAEFFLPIQKDMYILSVPKMLNNIEPFAEVFQFAPESRNTEQEEEIETGI